MRNVALCWPNRIDDATLTGGGWDADFPLYNVQDPEPTLVARTGSAAKSSTQFSITYASAKTFRAIAPMNTNASSDALIRITAGSTPGGSDLFDTDWIPLWSIVFAEDGVEWLGSGNWWGGTPDSRIYGAPWTPGYVLPADVLARYWKVEFDDEGNVDGYMQFGRLFHGPAFIPEYGVQMGAAYPLKDFSLKTALMNGGVVARRRRVARQAQFSLPLIWTGADEYRVHEMLRRQGTTGEIYYVPAWWDRERYQMLGFVGTLDVLSGMKTASYRTSGVSLQMTESI